MHLCMHLGHGLGVAVWMPLEVQHRAGLGSHTLLGDKTTSRPYVRYRKKGPCQWYTRMAPNLLIREIIGCMYAWAAYA